MSRMHQSETAAEPSITPEELDRLIEVASKAKSFAYAPYSNFRVGAALLSTCGEIVGGSNVENSSYGLAMCAERVATFQAVCRGLKTFRAIVVTSDLTGNYTYPCGACRQVLSEFGNMDVICLQSNGQTSRTTLAQLLPHAFRKEDLDEAEKQQSLPP